MRIIFHLVALYFIVLLLGGCSQLSQPTGRSKPPSQAVSYDANSWKTLIPDSCLHFFDGCNNCLRSAAGEVAACTRKACFKYQKPRCLDDVK